jgi:glutathione S-transferase
VITIADFFVFSALFNLFLIQCDLTPFRRVCQWIDRMQQTATYASTYAGMNALVDETIRKHPKPPVGTWDAEEAKQALDQYLSEFREAEKGPAGKFDLKTGTLKYFCGIHSPPARSVMHWLAENKAAGAKVEQISVEGKEFRCAEYRRIHFRGQVPSLADGTDFVLIESAVILRYLAGVFGDAAFPDNDICARARVTEIMSWFNSTFYGLCAFHFV